MSLSIEPAGEDDLPEVVILKGVGKIDGDGWKDTTRRGEIVFVWNDMRPEPYTLGQYPRVGEENWSASSAQYDFEPATVEEVRAAFRFTPSGAENIVVGGRTYERFILPPREVEDGTSRCLTCGQIDEPEIHEPTLCRLGAGVVAGSDMSQSLDQTGFGVWVATRVEGLAHAVADALAEANSAAEKWPAYNSAHEGFGVIAEEFQELTAHVFTNQSRRDLVAMRAEAIQLAATALRFAADVCDEDRGRR